MKNQLVRTLDSLRIPRFFLWLAPSPRILLYHGVHPGTGQGIFNYRKKFIDPHAFREQMKWLKQHFHIMPLDTLIEHVKSDKSSARPGLALTFDDGYDNLYQYAFPILKELDLPATVFVATGLIEGVPLWVDRLEYAIGNADISSITISHGEKTLQFPIDTYSQKCHADNELREYLKSVKTEEREQLLEEIENQCNKRLVITKQTPYQGLSWDQMKEMSRAGITFAAHTVTHPILSKTTKDQVKREIEESRLAILNNLSAVSDIFAYPNGRATDISPDAIETLRSLRFNNGLTTIPGMLRNSSDPFMLPRFTMDNSNYMPLFRLTVTGVRSRIQSIRESVRNLKGEPKDFFGETADSYLAEYGKETPEGFSFRERKRLTLDMLPKTADLSLLDVGSGPGIMIKELASRNIRVTAVDIAPQMITLLKKRFPDVEAHVGNIEQLDYPNESFDAVTALGVLEYLDADDLAMQEMARVLKPNGTAIISFPNWASPWRIWNRILLFLFGKPWRVVQSLLGRKRHPVLHREYAISDIERLAAKYHFRIEMIAGYNFKVLPLPLDRILPSLTIKIARLLAPLEYKKYKWLATAYLVKLEKE